MSAEENKAVIRRAAQAASSGDFDAFDELMAPDVAAQYKEGIAEFRRAFPDFRGADEIQIAEGDLVAGRFVFYGTHEGEFMGKAPTGRQVTFRGLSLNRVAEGKIVETWIEMDLENILGQIGAMVRAEPAAEADST